MSTISNADSMDKPFEWSEFDLTYLPGTQHRYSCNSDSYTWFHSEAVFQFSYLVFCDASSLHRFTFCTYTSSKGNDTVKLIGVITFN
jgi:hypothetical protein